MVQSSIERAIQQQWMIKMEDMKGKLIGYLRILLVQSEDCFPDNESQREGYRWAVEEILDEIRKWDEEA